MAFTQTQLDELTEAISKGVQTVRHSDGRSVTYQSLDMMRKLRQEMLDELNASAGTRRRRTMRVFQSGSGL